MGNNQNNDNDEQKVLPSGSELTDAVSDGIDVAKKAKKTYDKAKEADTAYKHAQAAQKAAKAINTAAKAGKAVQAGSEMAAIGETAKGAANAGKAAAETAAKASEAAATAGSAAATAGIALAVKLVYEAVKGTHGAMSELVTGEDSGFSLGKLIGIPIATVVFISYLFTFYATTNSSGEIENYEEVEYAADVLEEDSERNTEYKENAGETLSENVNVDQPYLNALTTYKEETDEALVKAFKNQLILMVEALHPEWQTRVKRAISNFIGTILGSDDVFVYDEEGTYNTLYSNPYPYSLKISDSEYYSIGDFLKTNGVEKYDLLFFDTDSFKEIPEDNLNDDLNYIEFNNVMSQGDDYITYGGKHQTYIEMFDDETCQSLLYEMTIENPAGDVAPTYYGIYYEYETVTKEDGTTETITHSIRTPDYSEKDEGLLPDCPEKYYYYNIVIRPYGLRELYAIANMSEGQTYILTEDDEQPGSDVYTNHPGMEDSGVEPILDYEMLDRNELYDRMYLRADSEESEIDEDFFGPSCDDERSELSTIYGYSAPTIDGSNVVTTGRSANFYIPLEKLITIENLDELANGNSDDINSNFEFENDDDYEVPKHEFNGNEDEFLKKIKEMVINDMHESGILASLTAAQALLESAHGTSGLTSKANNLFGIKGSYNGHSVTMYTLEYENGQYVRKPQPFRAYDSWEESIKDHSRLLSGSSRYSNLVGETNYKEAARKVREDGYATDPAYTKKLISIIETYKLYEWDTQ